MSHTLPFAAYFQVLFSIDVCLAWWHHTMPMDVWLVGPRTSFAVFDHGKLLDVELFGFVILPFISRISVTESCWGVVSQDACVSKLQLRVK